MSKQAMPRKPLVGLLAVVLTMSACASSTSDVSDHGESTANGEITATADRADVENESRASSEPTSAGLGDDGGDGVSHLDEPPPEDKQQVVDDQRSGVQHPLPLFGELTDDVAVLGVGTYQGVRPSERQLDNTSHGTTIAEVYVEMPDRPVLLVLSAYEPVLWQVDQAPGTDIIGVLISGYHGQALTGLQSQTPSFISSYEVPGDFQPTFVAHGTSPELLEANEIVELLTGRKMESFTDEAIDDIFFVGEAGPKVDDADRSPIDVWDEPYDPSTAEPAIARLVEEGLLRPATIEDAQAWLDKHNELYASLDTELKTLSLDLGRTFVVTGEVTLPDGLFGAHSVAFIVPDDVPQPDEPEGHNDFYWIADGSTNRPLE